MATLNGTSTQPQTTVVADLRTRDPRLANYRRQITAPDPFSEIGTTGLRQYGGFVLEEWLTTLQGRRGAWAYREMIDNCAVVGGILFAIKMLARKADWRVEGSDERMPRSGMLATEFVHSCMHDMSHPWGDVVSEALSFLGYGWALHEEVFKKRMGEQPDFPSEAGQIEEDETPASSKHIDGLIGWRKLPIRAQETLLNWEFEGYSGLKGMHQIDWHGGKHLIPIQKAILFRTESTRNNPEGRSILRNAWTSWYAMQNIQNIEAIGIERDLAGLPRFTAPEGVDIFADKHKELLELVKSMCSGIRKDEELGVILPFGWEFELTSTGGSRAIDTDQVIRRYRQEIAATVLGDFILVGLDGLGSYAMVDVKSDLFGLAVDATLDILCETFNRYAIPRLMRLNGAILNEMPRIAHSSCGRIDLEKVGNFLYHMTAAGAPIPWSNEMIEQLFNEAGLPANFPEENTEMVKKADPISVSGKLRERHNLLSVQLEREMQTALKQLGEQAATEYLKHAQPRGRVPFRKAKPQDIVGRVVSALNLQAWIRQHLQPILRNQAARTAADTQRVLQQEVGAEMRVAEGDILAIEKRAGEGLRMADIAPQVREAITRALEDSASLNENPLAVASRIKDYVPAGRFTKAGSSYRATLIARNETADMQRAAALSAYTSNPNVSGVIVRDGVYGPPRSDEECMARDGEIVSLAEAANIGTLHPLCTLSFDPVVGSLEPV